MKIELKNGTIRQASTETARQPASEDAWHVLPVETVQDRLQTDVVRGFTNSEAARRARAVWLQYLGPIAPTLDLGHPLGPVSQPHRGLAGRCHGDRFCYGRQH